MRLNRPAILIFLSQAPTACGFSQHDWSGTQVTLANTLPDGTSPGRAMAVLDSLGFYHDSLLRPDSVIVGRKREPMVFSTLRVLLTFDAQDRLVKRDIKEEFTRPCTEEI